MFPTSFSSGSALFLAAVQSTDGVPAEETKPDFFFMIAIILAIFWFVAIMPERKQRKKKAAMMEELKKNDRVLLSSGMYATVAAIGEQDITVKFDDGPTRVRVLKSAISTVLDKNEDGNDKS